MNDSFYTPDEIAAYMAAQSTLESPNSVADFAAGDGVLLSHVVKRWKNVAVYASDIDERAVRNLRNETEWSVSKCDFLSGRSRSQSPALKSILGGIDLILLNPPYSCRGASIYEVVVGGVAIKCSKALAFVLLSTEYLAENGQIVAILPQSSFISEKDEDGWKAIEDQYTVRRGTSAGRGVFKGCFARCTVVRLSPRKRARTTNRVLTKPRSKITVRLVRGSVPLHLDSGDDRTLVHSTDLVNSTVVLNGHVASKDRPSVIGPSVLLPRVGQPRIEKVAVYRRNKRVVLSDCVIGLQCKTVSDASWLHKKICENDGLYSSLYGGTCAKYTTVQRVVEFLSLLGCAVEV